ncbi:TPA: hypothetical protein N0F65_011283 [Lagenidium giganteum]|uniref:PX domain-containing protein n=1 Tax=Lagenidium giganteum TaxID=4803 RepID=A0AAV2YVY6_9STRA|nr:TPA: hypothetical protein N0F65_011283 [Lagenidium giganteum]
MRAIQAAPDAPQHLSKLVIRSSSVYGGGEGRPMVMGGTAIERSMVSVGSMAIYDVKPVVRTAKDKSHKQYTVYAVHVQNAISGRSWVVYRRYSDFLAFRELLMDHFKNYGELFSRLEEVVNDLYFPRKHKFRSKKSKVVEHRSEAFLNYLVAVHRVLISQHYLVRRDVSEIGLSILRGFLGSTMVRNADHMQYSNPKPVLQHLLHPANRTYVSQCGNLLTVPEDDKECEEIPEEFRDTAGTDWSSCDKLQFEEDQSSASTVSECDSPQRPWERKSRIIKK